MPSTRLPFQILVATMGQQDLSLISEMNIHSPAVIANQTNYSDTEKPSEHLTIIHTPTTGVGLNRNIALDAASAEICLFADDDVRYDTDYEQRVLDAFYSLPDADLVFFNLRAPSASSSPISHVHRVHWWNFLRYGTPRAAVRLDSIRAKRIRFNENFGGGTKYSHGEDSIFFSDCLRAGLHLYAVPVELGTLIEKRPSTWSNGYDSTYLNDQGVLYQTISPRLWPLLVMQDALRRGKKDYSVHPIEAFRTMAAGARVHAQSRV